MATDDEVRRLILEVIGEDKVKSLKEQIDKEKESLVSLTNTLAHLTPEQIANDKGVQLATQHLADLNQELAKTARSSRNLGYAALELSRGMEDLQYGVGGVINNIPGLVMALGGSAGLTAVISLVAVGINQLVKHLFPEWEGGVKKVKEEHEKLTQAMKDQKEALEALDKAKKTDEGIRGVVGARGEEMRKALGEQFVGESEEEARRLFAEETRLRRAGTPEAMALLPGVRQRFERARIMRETAQERANVIVGRAALGGLPEQARLRALFGPETAIGAELAEAGPERAEQRVQEERDVARQRQMAKLTEQVTQRREQQARQQAQQQLDRNTAQMKAIQDAEDVKNKQERDAQIARDKQQRQQDAAARKSEAAARKAETVQRHQEQLGERERLEAERQQEFAKSVQLEMLERRARMIGGQMGEVMLYNAQMMRDAMKIQHEQQRRIHESWEALEAAHQWNGKTGGL